MVTVTAAARASAGEDSFVSITGQNTANVGEIKAPITAEATKETIRTRGGTATATFTVKEGFASAFSADSDDGGPGGTMLRLQVAGVPEKATVTVSLGDGSTLGIEDGSERWSTEDEAPPRMNDGTDYGGPGWCNGEYGQGP